MSTTRCMSRALKAFPVKYTASASTSTMRAFHTSPSSHDMVAPPDPVSHMRPIIYDNPPEAIPEGTYVRHPYSLSEFQFKEDNTGSVSVGDNELQFKLLRQQLDTLHQNFWLDSNTRFYAAKQSVLSSLPETATARDKEDALSEFHKQWVMQEKDRTEAYTTEWRRRNMQLIAISARVEFAKLKARLSSIASCF